MMRRQPCSGTAMVARFFLLVAAAFAAAPTRAQSIYTWNVGTGGNGSGTWDTTSANWAGAGSTWVNGTTSNAMFSGGGSSAGAPAAYTIDGSITSGTITFGNGNNRWYTVSGGTLATNTFIFQASTGNNPPYSNLPTITVNSAVTVAGSTLLGRGGLVITGGTFSTNRLTTNPGTNTADWASLTLSGGVVTATNGVDGSYGTNGSNGTTATFALWLNSGTLSTSYFKVADRELGDFATSSSAVMTFNGATVRALSSTNNFIQTYGGQSPSTSNRAFIAGGDAILDTNGFDITVGVSLLSSSNNVVAANTGGVNKRGAGTLTLSGTNGYHGPTTVSAGSLVAGGTGAFGQASGRILAAGGILDLGGYNFTRTGTVSITGGTIQSGTLTNNTVAYDAQAGTVSAVLAGSAGLTKATSGTLTLAAAATYTGTTSIHAGTLRIGNGGTTGSLATTSTITGSAGATLAFDRTNTVTQGSDFHGVIGGPIAVTQLGSGTLVLNGNNTYSGGSTVTAGMLRVQVASSLGTGTATINGGVLDLDGAGVSNHIVLSSGTLRASGPAQGAGPITMTAGAIAGSGQLNVGAVTIGNTSTNPGATSLSGVTLTTPSLIVQGNAGNGTGAGTGTPFTVGSGTIEVSGNLGIGRWAMTIGGSSTVTVTGTIGGGGIASSADWGTLTITGSATVDTLGGVNGNTEAWSLNLDGGTLTTPFIEASDRESGGAARLLFNGTRVVATTSTTAFVRVGANSGATNSALVGGGGAIFDTSSHAVGIGVNLHDNGGGTLTKLGSGTLTLTGTNTYAGSTSVQAGVLRIGSGGSAGSLASSAISVAGGALLAFDRIDNYGGAISSVISGAGGVRVDSGFLTLAGHNTFTGTTSVLAGGTLAVNGSLANSALTVASGAALMGSGTIAGLTTVAGIHRPGNSPGIETFTNLTYDAGAAVQWELWGNTASNTPTAFDQVVVNGNLAFSGATALDLVFTGSAGPTNYSTVNWGNAFWDSNQEWLLYDVAGALTSPGNLSLTVTNWSDSTGALFQTVRPSASFSIVERTGDVYIAYAAAPEPSGLALAGIGAALTAWLAHRRRRRPPGGA